MIYWGVFSVNEHLENVNQISFISGNSQIKKVLEIFFLLLIFLQAHLSVGAPLFSMTLICRQHLNLHK